MEIREFFQNVVDLSFEELVSQCKPSAGRMLHICFNVYPDDDEKGFQLVNAIISSLICADGVVNRKEHEFYNAIFEQNLSYDDFNEIFKDQNSAKLRQSVKDFVNTLSYEDKKDIVFVLVCLAASNETISSEEVEYLTSLIS